MREGASRRHGHASVRELEDLLRREYPGINLDEEVRTAATAVDPYQLYRMLLLPLENVP